VDSVLLLYALVAVQSAGFGAAYTIDVALFTFALWALWPLPDLPPLAEGGADGAAGPSRRGLASVVAGLHYLATRPNVAMTFVVDLIAMVLAMLRVLFVGVVFLGGGATTTGLLSGAYAAAGARGRPGAGHALPGPGCGAACRASSSWWWPAVPGSATWSWARGRAGSAKAGPQSSVG